MSKGETTVGVTFGGPLKSWIFISMSLIQPCISSGESVYRETRPENKVLYSYCGYCSGFVLHHISFFPLLK